MAFNSKNLTLLQPRVGTAEGGTDAGYGTALWCYRDNGGDNLAAMQADGFITDMDDYGIRVGDIIIAIDDTVDASWLLVSGVGVTVAGAADTIIVSNP